MTACARVFRDPVRTGRRGRPRLVLAAGCLLGQVVKRYAKRRVAGVSHRVVDGSLDAITAGVAAPAAGTGISTASIDRLNATVRSHLAPLVRRGRASARPEAALTAGMWLVGGADNVCWPHGSPRLAAPAGAGRKWPERTPAMAAGLTDHRWTMRERLHYRIPVPAWVPPTRRRRRPNAAAHALAA